MSPVDWALSLDTSFTVEDVADSPDVIIMQIQNKAAQLDAYKNQLSLLQGAVDGDPATLKAAVDAAARNLDKAESNLNSRYLDSTIELAKMVINYSTGGAAAVVSKVADMTKELDGGVKKLDPNGSTDDIKAQLGNVSASMQIKYNAPCGLLLAFTQVGDAQRALQQATSVYASQSAALARAEATDTRTAQANIQRNIDSLVQEIADLRAKLSAANDSANKLKALNDAHPDGLKVDDLAAATVTKTPGGSRWQSVIVSRKMKFTRDDSKTTTDFSRTSWSCDFWIASGQCCHSSILDAYEADRLQFCLSCLQVVSRLLYTKRHSSWPMTEVFFSRWK